MNKALFVRSVLARSLVACVASVASVAAVASVACGGPTMDPAAPVVVPPQPSAAPVAASAEPAAPVATAPAASAAATPATTATADAPQGELVDGDTFRDKPFTLADATAGLDGKGPLVATIKTSQGELRCKLFDDKAPITVANFVGLARGTRPWKSANGWVKRPLYDGTTFHRIIQGFMIQGGDPEGTGRGEPGYVIKDEMWKGGKHDRAGLLCMANRGPNTNGAQFFITDAGSPHLDRSYTIFGECSPVSVVHAIAGVPTGPGDRPVTPVTIDKVEITRANP
jgi:peptidyl-prolyl cis-trans isomerase A (cyclophilin A)